MAKCRCKPKKRFGVAGGQHSRSVKYKATYTHHSTVLCDLNLKIRKRKVFKCRKTLKRSLLSNIVRKELVSKQYRCIPSVGSLILTLKKVQHVNLKGYRMMNLDSLQTHMNIVVKHCVTCSKARHLLDIDQPVIEIQSELRTHGLASVLGVRCVACKMQLLFETSPKLKTNNSTKYDINVRAVWGSIVTGNGASHLKEMMATMDAPSLSQPAFSNIEQDIGYWWENISHQELLAAGAEERRIAIEKGQYHHGVPSITVIADGGWSKRTHKHSYNALGGMGIIIGKETGKILHIGIRNKYCYICSHSENNHDKTPNHVCFKNWNSNSQSMEADIILDGFKKAENMHGLRYMWLVADGDSSMFAKIREVPVWGAEVQKIECANHMCKCLRSNLEKLVETNPAYKGKNKLTKATRVRIVSAVRCAISMRSKQTDKTQASKQLAKDIRNSVHHIFGRHDNCSDFCKARVQGESNCTNADEINEKVSKMDLHSDCDQASEVCTHTALLWSEGSSLTQQENSRYGSALSYTDLDSMMLQDIALLLGRVADKSHRLIQNTTNLAECWMHIRTKFDGGKVYNICNRGSWHTRCYGGSLRTNVGPQWSPSVWKRCTGTSAGHNFVKLFNEREKQLHFSTVSKKNPKASMLRWKRKMSGLKESTSKSAKQSYGSEALDHETDISKEDLQLKQSQFYKQHIELSSQQILALESITKLQCESQVWHDERKKRITASMFGNVTKRRPTIPVSKLIQQMLYSKFTGNQHTRTGLQQERATVHEYVLKRAEEGVNVEVKRSGLVVNENYKFLGGSPDGIVYENGQKAGLIEVKNVLHNKTCNLSQAAKSNKTFCLKFEEGHLHLKHNHNYYIQCQGLLKVCNLPWIDFVIRTLNPYQMHIERIFSNENLWKLWLSKLKAFYDLAVLPELACPRKGKVPGIREPGVWFEDRKTKALPLKRRQTAQNEQLKRRQTGEDEPEGSVSQNMATDPVPLQRSLRRRTVCRTTKFLGRRISHEWKVTDDSDTTEWYPGTITALLSGTDGVDNAVYEVLYDGEDEPYEIT